MKNRTLNFLLFLIIAAYTSPVLAQQKKWTIKECVEYALEHNISVRQSVLDTLDAAIERSDAFGNFLPSVNGQAQHSWNIGLNQNITTGLLENQTTQFTSAGITAGITLYNGLQNQQRLQRARLSSVVSKYKLVKMKDDISLNVANAFLQILFNKENLKVQQEQLLNNNRLLNRTQELVSAGSIPKGDLLDVRATVASNEQAVVAAENTLLLSKLSLAQLLQLEDFQNFDIADTDYDVQESPVMLQTPNAIFEKAKEERVELKIARTNLELAERDVRIARSAYHPTLQGFYSFSTRAAYSDRVVGVIPNVTNPTSPVGTVVIDGTTYSVLQQNFSPVLGGPAPIWDQFDDNKGHSFGLQLNVPIFNGFAVRNNVARARINSQRFQIAYEQQELDLERNVFTAFADANGALNTYEAASAALAARQEAFNYAQEKFNVGLMNAFDLDQAQTLYVNAQSDVLRAKYDYIFRVKVVEFYFGIPIIQN